MSPDPTEALEQAIALYLERRLDEPNLDPASFAAEPGMPDGLLDALRAALAAEAQLADAGERAPHGIGPYRVLRRLGQGGMGVVYEVEREGRRFALKRLRADLADARARVRFLREADLLRRLEHPGIVGVHDVGSEHGEAFLVMELIDGAPLLQAAKDWPLPRKLRATIELCDAVAAAHERGLLHRDLKPHNVLVRSDGRCVLIDFGLGSAADDATLTATGERLGTPRYMSPEQARGERADARSDVWGLGQILFELLLGRPAIEEASRALVLRRVERGSLPRPRAIDPTIDKALERVLLTALAFDPRRRYRGPSELALDLERFLAGQAVLARPPGLVSRTQARLAQRPALSAAVLAGVLLVACSVFLTWQSRRSEREDTARWHLDRAFLSWTGGDLAGARHEAEAALRLRSDDPSALALRATLDPALDDAQSPWLQALRSLAAQGAEQAAREFAALGRVNVHAAVLEAHALRLAGRSSEAAARLEKIVAREPRSVFAAVERARTLAALGDREGQLAQLRRALELAPADARLRLELADALLQAGEIEAGVDEALGAARLGRARGELSAPTLARRLQRAGNAASMRAALERRIDDPNSAADARFALAVSWDGEHQIEKAASLYEQAWQADPGSGWALAYLGHLRAGADLEHCEPCRAAFAAQPDLLDRDQAASLFARAALADRGRDVELLRTLTYLARDHDLCEKLAEAIESLLREEPNSPMQGRWLDTLRGLRR